MTRDYHLLRGNSTGVKLTDMKRPVPKSFVGLIAALLIAFSFSAGFLVGQEQGVRSVVPVGEGKVLGVGEVPPGLDKDVNFSLFWNVWNLVKDEYVDQPISEKDLLYGSLKGMVAALGDQHSLFFDPEMAKEFASQLSGSFDGIGAEIEVKDSQLVIIAPLPGTPAEKAGLLTGDRILAIDGVETAGMPVDEAVKRIRGQKHTTVTLTISRDGWTQAKDYPIVRDTIVVESVKYTLRDDKIAVITIASFGEDTSRLFKIASDQAIKDGAKGIVLDLRGDPGGYLNAAIDVSSAWVGESTVVIEKIKDQEQKNIGTSLATLTGMPTVVLVNGGSASASEIVSGALQDHKDATIVGEQSFGKGSVQDYRDLPDGSAVKLTIARWYTPNDRSIDKLGITPDVIVPMTQADVDAGKDPQMDKAIEILTK